MAGRNPNEAFRNFITPIENALRCVTQARLTTGKRPAFAVGPHYTVALNDMDPVALRGPTHMSLSAGQVVRIVQVDDPDNPRGPYKIQTVQYFYDVLTSDGQEILSFHWTPEDSPPNRTFPHLHIGSVMLDADAHPLSKRFSKAHIPTGRVSVEAVVRFIIEECEVEPLRSSWREILAGSEDAFVQWRVRS